ncbi:hypothetical protein KC361_g256 [Hortaea werneckii]|nr:hypothetical protein KC361_g256 [Hortaea werneckii]
MTWLSCNFLGDDSLRDPDAAAALSSSLGLNRKHPGSPLRLSRTIPKVAAFMPTNRISCFRSAVRPVGN